jgi:hypothetical protein
VQLYVGKVAKDPDSVTINHCGPVAAQGAYWVVECTWRGKNSFGAVVPADQRFFIQAGGAAGEGRVVRTESAL